MALHGGYVSNCFVANTSTYWYGRRDPVEPRAGFHCDSRSDRLALLQSSAGRIGPMGISIPSGPEYSFAEPDSARVSSAIRRRITSQYAGLISIPYRQEHVHISKPGHGRPAGRRTRFAILRGGSFHQASESVGYTDGGPQPGRFGLELLLLWTTLDQCVTAGYGFAAWVESPAG